MKYMGSKRWMLSNGLGDSLDKACTNAKRFVDLFSGSGAVASHVAMNKDIPVLANDLQVFSAVLAGAVISRTEALKASDIWNAWSKRANQRVAQKKSVVLTKITQATVAAARDWCAEQTGYQVTKAYGGHYFSPLQAIWIDALKHTLPRKEPNKTVALAALIEAASRCAASPGHTAQPFQVTRTAKPFLVDAWTRSIPSQVEASLITLCKKFAKSKGQVKVADALEVAKTLRKGDLVFVDPPYSGVHYSRFYHVLETIAAGYSGDITGVGRYPASKDRPSSDFSILSKSEKALDDLLSAVAKRGARAIVTFPDHDCSNGLSGELVREVAKKYFKLSEKTVKSKFSTLGGTSRKSKTNNKRAARQSAKELILSLEPK